MRREDRGPDHGCMRFDGRRTGALCLAGFEGSWLGNLDSNQDKQSQSLLCYRYTIPQKALSPNEIRADCGRWAALRERVASSGCPAI
jgi:hypothetical protein